MKKSVRVSNPNDPNRGPRPRPQSPAASVVPGSRVSGAERRVLLVSCLGVVAAMVGLTVSILVDSGSEEADSDSAATLTTSAESAASPVAAVPPAPVTTAPATPQYLADMTPTSGPAYTGSIIVNGTTYPHAIYQQFNGCNTEVSHTYNLNREWSRFSSVVGIADGGNTSSVLRFEVSADGNEIYSSENVRAGESPTVNVPVTGVQALTISFTFVDGNMASCGQVGNGVWGDAALTK